MSRRPEKTLPKDSRVAVVTGGAGAIGSAIVEALRATGHQTVVIDRTGTFAADLGSEAATREVASAVLKECGRVDVYVQCAAAFDQAPIAELDAATLRHVMAVNV